MPLKERIYRSLKSVYRRYWARKADYYETQTEIAKAGIVSKLGVTPNRVLVLSNSPNRRFVEANRSLSRDAGIHVPNRVFCLSAGYPHKNLALIPQVAYYMRRMDIEVPKFVFTLPEKEWMAIFRLGRQLDVDNWLENAGPLTLDGCIKQFRSAGCLLLPTLAEIFSATYLEAMAMGVPVVTTDLDFAHAICGEAAMYFSPLSARDAANAVSAVMRDVELRARLVGGGFRRLAEFPDPETKHQRLVTWLTDLASDVSRKGRSDE